MAGSEVRATSSIARDALGLPIAAEGIAEGRGIGGRGTLGRLPEGGPA